MTICTRDECLAIIERLRRGESITQIARSTGRDRSTYREAFARFGLGSIDSHKTQPGRPMSVPDGSWQRCTISETTVHPAPSVTTSYVPRAEPADAMPPRQVDALRQRLAAEQHRRKEAEREATEAEVRAGLADELRAQCISPPPIVPSAPRTKSRTRAVPVLLCSDWHVEEVVDPSTINGRNAYNLEIAQQRIDRMFRGARWYFNHWASGWDIAEAVIWFGGDLITGHLHEDQRMGNSLAPVEAVLLVQRLVAQHLDQMLAELPWLRTIYVPWSHGNHGRTTDKPLVAASAKTSYEWLIGQTLAERYAGNPRVRFEVAGGAHIYQDIAGTRVRFLHGDDVKYQGGIGGLSIPLRKSVVAWDTFERADVTCLGHYHRVSDFGWAVCNGSVVGYNPFALRRTKAEFEPPQQAAFLIDEERGLSSGVARIFCDQGRRAA